jgi:cytochrome c oxidase subunit III
MILLGGVAVLPSDHRARQGGLLFLAMLLVFFLTSLLLYANYTISRLDDPHRSASLPRAFLLSTVCLLAVSGMLHVAARAIRRDRLLKTSLLLGISALVATLFLAIQVWAMFQLIGGPIIEAGSGRGLAGMVVVLAFLHALHVAGGVIALGVVAIRAAKGRYDHERHFAVDFAAQYWHFLDAVWLVMLAVFWSTTGGF